MAYKKPGYYTLYKTTFPNGKVYIGITSRFLKDRIWSHSRPSQNKKQRPMYNALQKYSTDVKWETLLTFDKIEDAKYAEIEFIKFYNSTNITKGYNLTNGGEGTFGLKRNDLLVKLIDNAGNVFDGYEHAMSHYNLTRPQIRTSIVFGSYCGHVYFSTYKAGMLKAEPRRVSNKYRRKVYDHVNDIIFFSVTDACEFHNITQATLASKCRPKKTKTPQFSYFEEIK